MMAANLKLYLKTKWLSKIWSRLNWKLSPFIFAKSKHNFKWDLNAKNRLDYRTANWQKWFLSIFIFATFLRMLFKLTFAILTIRCHFTNILDWNNNGISLSNLKNILEWLPCRQDLFLIKSNCKKSLPFVFLMMVSFKIMIME